MFPHLQSIALRAKFKKGDQSVSSNRNTSTIQECCHPHEKHPHLSLEEKRQGQTAQMKSRVHVPHDPQLRLKATREGHTRTGTAKKNTQVPQ